MKSCWLVLVFLLLGFVCYGQDNSNDDYEAPVVNCAPAAKIDEFNFTSINGARERLDLFGLQLKNSNALGIVIGYGGKNSESNEGRNIASEIEQYLTPKFKFTSYYTISIRDGGHRSEKSVELFIKYNSCGADPSVSPTLNFDEVNYKEEKDFFEKAVVRKASTEMRRLLVGDIDPTYPPAARAVMATGKVVVLVEVSEDGNVVKAMAIDGHPLLRSAAVNAIKKVSFRTLAKQGRAVKYGGKIEIDFDPIVEEITKDNY